MIAFADKVAAGTYNVVPIRVKIILLGLALVLSLSAALKIQYLLLLNFNSTLQLINDISSDLHKLLRHFNGTAIVTFFRIPSLLCGVDWATVFGSNLLPYLKDLKALLFPISAIKLVASSFQWKINYPLY